MTVSDNKSEGRPPGHPPLCPDSETVRLHVKLPAQLRDALRELAERNKRTVSEEVRDAIEERVSE